MKRLNNELVNKIASSLKGKKLENFLNSVGILNTSVDLGGWTSRGSVKYPKGINMGLGKISFDKDYDQSYDYSQEHGRQKSQE